jgi:hypothetical protein
MLALWVFGEEAQNDHERRTQFTTKKISFLGKFQIIKGRKRAINSFSFGLIHT